MIELKVDKPRRLKPGAALEVTSIYKVNTKLTRVNAGVVPTAKARLVIYTSPKEVDWSRIADLIAEGYTSGLDRPEGTAWELFSEW